VGQGNGKVFLRVMFVVRVKSKFSSAHSLRGYKGKCEDLHGHNWGVEVAASSAELDEIGMVVDFKDLKNILNAILSDLDHKHLNEVEYFKEVNPTSENIGQYIYDKMSELMPGINIKEVTVWETDSASATYSK